MTTSNKFKEASDALYMGDGETAAKLLTDGVAEVARANTPAVDTDALVNAVRQELKAAPAREQLFKDYPALKEKRAYALMADDAAAEFMAQGDPIDVAIRKAGEKVAAEYDLGRHGRSSRQAGQSSRQSEAIDDQEEDYPTVISDMATSRPGSMHR